MYGRVLMITALIWVLAGIAAARDADPVDEVGEWLDANDISYTVIESGGYALAFEGDEVERIDVQIDFSDDFVHIGVPIGYIPENPGEAYLWDIIRITGSAPMIKPVIDDDRFFFLALDLPKAALSKDELISDLLSMVDFVDNNFTILEPDTREE